MLTLFAFPPHRYCDSVRKDHLKLLKSYSVMSFKGYLIWYHKTHPHAQRLNTYESVWKLLRQLYYDICHKVVASDVGEEVTNVRLYGGSISRQLCALHNKQANMKVQTNEFTSKDRTSPSGDSFWLSYRQLFLFALRHFPEMDGQSPRKDAP